MLAVTEQYATFIPRHAERQSIINPTVLLPQGVSSWLEGCGEVLPRGFATVLVKVAILASVDRWLCVRNGCHVNVAINRSLE